MMSAYASMGEMGPFLWTGSMRNEVRVPLLLPVIPRLAAVDTSLSWTLSRLPRGGRWGGASRVPGMDSCSEAGMTVEPRRARARGYPEGGYGAGPLPRPRDGFLLGGRIDGGRLLPLTAPIPLTPVSSTGQALSLSKGVSGRSVALQPTLALPTPVENAAPCGRSRLSHVERYRMGE